MGSVADGRGAFPDAVLGISTWASPADHSWSGILRARWSDFQVFEIGLDGNTVHLKDCRAARAQPEPETTVDDGNENGSAVHPASEERQEPVVPPTDISPEAMSTLGSLTGETFALQLVELYRRSHDSLRKARHPACQVRTDPIHDKERRRNIHETIRRVFQSRIQTIVVDGDAIEACLGPPEQPARPRQQRRRGADRHRPTGEYLHFTLYKENRATMETIQHMADRLKVPSSSIAISGTKDRRAVTSQRCAVRRMSPGRLVGLNGRIFGVRVGDFEYRDEGLWLGALVGNEFVITVKDCRSSLDLPVHSLADRVENMHKCVKPALASASACGFINYYGLQRFGSYTTGTHEVGKHLLNGDAAAAIDAILAYDPVLAALPAAPDNQDVYHRAIACRMFADKDVDGALQTLPKRFFTEAALMRHIPRTPTSRISLNLISVVPRHVRTLYLHAYQSFVWNHAASHRWDIYGPVVVEGDLIIEPAPVPESNQAARPDTKAVDEDLEEDLEDLEEDGLGRGVRLLTAEEAASGRYAITDVVLPIPGYQVQYPTNAVGVFYTDFMGRAENGGLDPRAMRRPQREYSLPGRYRRLLATFLSQPSYEVRTYARDDEQLHPSDLDQLRERGLDTVNPSGLANKRGRIHNNGSPGETVSKKARLADGASQPGPANDETSGNRAEIEPEPGAAGMDDDAQPPMEVPVADKVAVVLTFQLGKSAYATVALRELMRAKPSVGAE